MIHKNKIFPNIHLIYIKNFAYLYIQFKYNVSVGCLSYQVQNFAYLYIQFKYNVSVGCLSYQVYLDCTYLCNFSVVNVGIMNACKSDIVLKATVYPCRAFFALHNGTVSLAFLFSVNLKCSFQQSISSAIRDKILGKK